MSARLRTLAKALRDQAPSFRRWVLQPNGLWPDDRAEAIRVTLEHLRDGQCTPEEFADEWLQAMVTGSIVWQRIRRRYPNSLCRRIVSRCPPLQKEMLEAIDRCTGNESGGVAELPGGDASWWRETIQPVIDEVAAGSASASEQTPHLVEQFLGYHDGTTRQQHGVYFTPPELTRFVVNQLDWRMRQGFGLDTGLADLACRRAVNGDETRHTDGQLGWEDLPFIQILDPAAGAGVFLIAVIDRIYQTMQVHWSNSGTPRHQWNDAWNDYVGTHLLTRLFGLELLLAPALVGTLSVAERLAETGYRFESPAPVEFHVANTLAGPSSSPPLLPPQWQDVWQRAEEVRYVHPATVLVGNPPFSGISENRGRWMKRLLRGQWPHAGGSASYYHIDGQPLKERKVWIQDDYVKFLRYAHWSVVRSGGGAIGFVTNHGYLDNASFRAMRHQLLQDFSQIDIVDLHGNRRRGEQQMQGTIDENVFAIDAGISVGLFTRSTRPRASRVRFAETWGRRSVKLRHISELEDDDWRVVQPAAPHFLLRPADDDQCPAYQAGIRLPDAMPASCTAAVTARDRLVVAWTEKMLEERLERFCDLSVSDDEIRREFFPRPRSSRYLPGDTRGWSLAQARRRLADDVDRRARIKPCLYRPFDWRVIFWSPDMIDWPRDDMMQHMTHGANWALVTRRQMLPTQPCAFFWITDGIVIDGVIRSDNRGSESFFPLFLYQHHGDDGMAPRGRQANFASEFIERVSRVTGLMWRAVDNPADKTRFGPFDLFGYIYALFHSPTYRQRYSRYLHLDFPRVLIPCTRELFARLSEFGRELVELHLNPSVTWRASAGTATAHGNSVPDWTRVPDEAIKVERAYPKHGGQQIELTPDVALSPVSRSAWEFLVGGHQVCRKWLRDRRSLPLTPAMMEQYRQIVWAVERTLHTMKSIDDTITRSGGWPNAFLTGDRIPQQSG